MKRAVSVSLGSSSRDKCVTVEFGGDPDDKHITTSDIFMDFYFTFTIWKLSNCGINYTITFHQMITDFGG